MTSAEKLRINVGKFYKKKTTTPVISLKTDYGSYVYFYCYLSGNESIIFDIISLFSSDFLFSFSAISLSTEYTLPSIRYDGFTLRAEHISRNIEKLGAALPFSMFDK